MSWDKWAGAGSRGASKVKGGTREALVSSCGPLGPEVCSCFDPCSTKVVSGRGLVTGTPFSHLKSGTSILIIAHDPCAKRLSLGVTHIWVKILALPLRAWLEDAGK